MIEEKSYKILCRLKQKYHYKLTIGFINLWNNNEVTFELKDLKSDIYVVVSHVRHPVSNSVSTEKVFIPICCFLKIKLVNT